MMKYMCKHHLNNPHSHRKSVTRIGIQSCITLILSIELKCQACCEGYPSRVLKFMSKLSDFLWLSLSWLRISWPPSWDWSQKSQERPGETQANFCWWVQGKIIINLILPPPFPGLCLQNHLSKKECSEARERNCYLWICGCFLFLSFGQCGMQDLSFPTRDRTCAPAVEAQILNHWTARETPINPLKL